MEAAVEIFFLNLDFLDHGAHKFNLLCLFLLSHLGDNLSFYGLVDMMRVKLCRGESNEFLKNG